MKRIVLIISLLMACAMLHAETFVIGDLEYEIRKSHENDTVFCASVKSYMGDRSSLTCLTIPDEVEYNGKIYPVRGINEAFNNCTSLTEITFGRNLRYVYCYAFRGSAPVKRIVWMPQKSVEQVEIATGAPTIRSTEKNATGFWTLGDMDVSQLEELVVADGVEEIGQPFIAGAPITALHLPATLTSCDPMSFEYCGRLCTITVDPANSVLDSRYGCNAVIDSKTNELIMACPATRLPESVTGIGKNAYCTCPGIKSVVIPSGVTKIGTGAFIDCWQLEEMHIRVAYPNKITLERAALNFNVGNCTLYVPVGARSRYLVYPWKNFKAVVEEDFYQGPEDVNGDGRVDIDDVNTVVNAVLAK